MNLVRLFGTALLDFLGVQLRRMAPGLITKFAARLSEVFKTPVEANAASIMSKCREWIVANPKSALVIANAMVNVGISLSEMLIEKLDQIITGAEPGSIEAIGGPVLSAVAKETLRNINARRQSHTGDGMSDTVDGEHDLFMPSFEQRQVSDALLTSAVNTCGSIESFMALRAAMFLEDDTVNRFFYNNRDIA